MPRNHEKDMQFREDKKKHILKSALPLFVANGPQATTISEIAKAAGMSKGLIYNYFESKEELYSILAADILGISEKDAHDLLHVTEGTPWDRLCKVAKDVVIRRVSKLAGDEGIGMQFNLAFSMQFLSFEQLPEPYKSNVNKAYDFNRHTIAQLIEQGQACGQLIEGPSYQLAIHYSSVVNGMFMENIRHEGLFDEIAVENALKLFLRQ
ncbi:TetR/AcrR family transcriptional regulator [Paenibacillus radicis (ex Gao et al. 2016)]|uniref:HTH-type transcriptional regulator AcrR n=1 Tax=Paenibacillus radicis (ex Gao et al. 2016) TaxID=1737354 RepID=A0A917H6G8_9BACL|nr:TetR/AcrR family transcriptional regulator [Paenibacillus radicis (ex Gao et al. 2016)]GGG68088.1 HTH-type transcriptional regulator AcrR [Paenibacillus radicis (ex Gao et al. 2016)]